MLAAHWQTDWVVWEKEEGKRGRGWMEKKIPILRLAGRAHWRSAILPGFFGGGGIESLSAPPLWVSGAPRLGPLDSLALYSASFQTLKKNPPTFLDAHQRAPCSASTPRWKSKSALNVFTVNHMCNWKRRVEKNLAGILEVYYTHFTVKL